MGYTDCALVCQYADKLIQLDALDCKAMVIEKVSTLETDTKNNHMQRFTVSVQKTCLYSGYSESQALSKSAPCHFPAFVKTVSGQAIYRQYMKYGSYLVEGECPGIFALSVRDTCDG